MTFARVNSTMPLVRILLCFLILQLIPLCAMAQEQPSASLITIGPGDASYEKFGHNILHIRDPQQQIDVVFNWGVFDFGDDFVFNFVQGRLWYWMAESFQGPSGPIEFYRSQDRSIWVQELNLSPQQVRVMLNQCMVDLEALGHPGKGYRYDYYRDNCSTRTRDAIDRAIGGQVKALATTMPSDATYRSETRRLMADVLPLYLGLNYVLGHPTDAKLSASEEMFIPMRMRERFNSMMILDESGQRVPLVRSESVVHESGHLRERTNPPNYIPGFAITSTLIGGLLAWTVRKTGRKSKFGTWGYAGAVVLISLLLGVGGVILAYFWLVTDHSATRPNENILQLGPWTLLLVVLVPLGLRGKGWAIRGGRLIAVGGLVLSMLGLILKVLPILGQPNGEIIALALPLHVGLAWAIWTMHGSREVVSVAAERSST